ncbi:squamous cell carcinoma antigen recognized by T-cells 3-like [Amphibalanus amphitrite]|uniref:squamous cell carcinoma antigen recognized by T-cells 3-like n=1 Tax=Amphibalanus amphitrite TaxID=1232801 RepID=UPI001C9281CB|nr:squamous cell carcinoma antigen recognized by T-cells 3-like [Amphibalanus amphitrite]XP_043221069.1 squamous cell carcinoma antigen recognized by T-cells 3-like [Amphibalanus amphitrite]XP_043221070.1 squamous cell carcinoma antigen recognized by T-cells 3-like [Amphibalanus amphitrite]XP_043221071.1 squamous cell carcinoma antigen recognized by T-cells 3-like [Amphibalanus amphitrite]
MDNHKEDQDMADNSSDSDSSMEDDTQQEEITTLMKEVQESPYKYDSHVRLIELLRSSDSRQMLTESRETMNKYFPLSPTLWLSWIRDEQQWAETDEERQRVLALCDRAVAEYVSVDLWLEYCQLAIGGLAAADGPARVRAVFERALTAVGLHVTKGALIWEAYREFENALYSTLQEAGGEAAAEARGRVTALFRRQLRQPLVGLELCWAEFEAWLAADGAAPDANDKRNYEKALERLETLQPLEEALTEEAEGGGTVAAYQQYVRHELTDGTPARVQLVFERAVLDNCLSLELWQAYTRYLDFELRPAGDVTLAVHERAVRNLPWSAELWESYIRAAERAQLPLERLEDLVSRALVSGLQTPADVLLVWLAWIDLYRRRLSSDGRKGAELMVSMREQFNKACEHLAQAFGMDGDPECVLLQYWASLEAANGCLGEATALWEDILSQGHDKSARMWLQFLRLVQRFGTAEQLRKLCARAMERTVDWPESVYELWAAFERERGTLDTWDQMAYKYRVRMKRVEALRAKEAEKQAEEQQRVQEKLEKRKQRDVERRKTKRQELRAEKQQFARPDSAAGQKRKRGSEDGEEDEEEPRPAPAQRTAADPAMPPPPPGFKKPAPPAADGKPAPPPGFKPPPPPPGYKPKEPAREAPPKAGEEGGSTGDVERDSRTVFLSNLDFNISADRLRQHWQSTGEIADLRVVKDYKGRSKGFAYLEFTNIAAAEAALKQDHSPIDGRPCFVSRLWSGGERPKAFKYNTGMERNKLFIKGLSLKTTADTLRTKFSEFGPLKDVRLVTLRNGYPKGIAYVEFEDEAAAQRAVEQTDQTQLEGSTILVAISDPSKARGGAGAPTGAGGAGGAGRPPPRPAAGRGAPARGRRQQTAFVPRALQKRPDQAASGEPAAPPKSNAEFRNLLLAKKD